MFPEVAVLCECVHVLQLGDDGVHAHFHQSAHAVPVRGQLAGSLDILPLCLDSPHFIPTEVGTFPDVCSLVMTQILVND